MPHTATLTVWKNSLKMAQKALDELIGNEDLLKKCCEFSDLMTECVRGGGNIFVCGNGGSHCEAMHLAEEWTGRFRGNRRPVGALALGDSSHLSCVANDFGYEHVFSRQIEGLARKGDLLVLLSTSGKSPNLLEAAKSAQKLDLITVALLGKDGGPLKSQVNLAIVAPGTTADRIQELHLKMIHTVIEATERTLFPENYKDQ